MNTRNIGDRVGERFEEIKLEGSQLVDKVKELATEGKTRRVTIIKDGRTLADFPFISAWEVLLRRSGSCQPSLRLEQSLRS